MGRDRSYRNSGITLSPNSVNPGTIETPMVDQWLEENAERRDTTPDDVLEETVEMHTLDRIGQPEEIGHVVALLLSTEGEWITGESIDVDGASRPGENRIRPV